MHHGEIGERRIVGDAVRELHSLGETLAFVDEVLRQPDGLALFGGQRARGQHHVHDARGADQRRQPHRSAAADIDAAAAFGQRVERIALGDAHMRRRRQFQSATDHGAMQDGDHRHAAELHAIESAVPGSRMRDPVEGLAIDQFGQVEPGAEIIAFAA